MEFFSERSIICLSDPKQSALYFDRILPISYFFEEFNPDGHTSEQNQTHNRIIRNLIGLDQSIGDDLAEFIMRLQTQAFSRLLSDTDKQTENAFNDMLRKCKQYKKRSYNTYSEVIAASYVLGDEMSKEDTTVREFLLKFASEIGINRPSISVPSPCLTDNATLDDISLIMSELHLVDTSKASWEQILEIRKDKDAKKKS